MSRFAACTPGVIDGCVRAVASEVTDLDQVIPGWSKREVGLVARDALEAIELSDAVSAALMGGELQASDWVRSLLAEGRLFLSQRLREAGQPDRARALYDLAGRALEDIAASSDRSRVLWYEDIVLQAAQSLVRRGDRAGLVRQIESLAEEVRDPRGANIRGALLMLADFQIELGDHRAGLSLTAAVARRDPADPWTYNAIALGFPRLGLPSLGRLAGERGLALVARNGDPDRLSDQLREIVGDIGSQTDRSDAPADAIADLRDALETDFDSPSSEDWTDLARRLVPDVASARVKELPATPTDDALASIAARLREGVKKANAQARAPKPIAPPAPVTRIAPNAAPSGPKVGRNDPCPCGSGKKYKKCCLA